MVEPAHAERSIAHDRTVPRPARGGCRYYDTVGLAALTDFPTAVIALGAGHSHFEDEERFEEAARVLGAAFVVLLLPSPDPAESLRVLRERCDRDKGTDWIRDGHDYLEEWIGSRQNLSLADLVVFGDGRYGGEIAHQIASAVTVDPA